MNIDDFLKKIQGDIDRQMSELQSWKADVATSETNYELMHYCPYCSKELKGKVSYRYCPYCGNSLEQQDKAKQQPLYKLTHYDKLEEETKAKIGTFERIYQQIFQEETQVELVENRSFNYKTLDYAPLVNPLASALEIELNLAVFQLLRKTYGAKRTLTWLGYWVALSKETSTMNDYRICMIADAQDEGYLLQNGFPYAEECAGKLNSIAQMRNRANHKEQIGKYEFLDFYEKVYNFFEKYMPFFIKLKEETRKTTDLSFHSQTEGQSRNAKMLSAKAELNSFFAKFNSGEKNEKVEEVRYKSQGIIFTDTAKLAIKSFGSLSSPAPDGEVYDFVGHLRRSIHEYAQEYRQFGVNYLIFDLAEYPEIKQGSSTWRDFSRALNNFYFKNFPHQNEPVALFIIGGQDVIPMPQIYSPFYIQSGDQHRDEGIARQNMHGEDFFERTLESDMLYAYEDVDAPIVDDNGIVDYELIATKMPRYCIGRLPMAEGQIDNWEYVPQYLSRALKESVHLCQDNEGNQFYALAGIRVKNHVATACESAEIVTSKVLEGFPLQPLEQRYGFINENHMVVSPSLDLRTQGGRSDDYGAIVERADMLSFILHGSSISSSSGYYGERKEKNEGGFLGFSPELLKNSQAKVVSGICCWGARFIGFPQEQSILLSALNENVLLFMGSCRSARGAFDIHLQYGCRITLAEVLLRYYIDFLLQGYEAGEALERAKRLYLHCPDTDRMDVLATILEFNLFGDPLLHVYPLVERHSVEPMPEQNTDDFHSPRNYKLEFDKQEKKSSLIDYVRKQVDKNLQEIHNKVNKELYNTLGIEADTLSTIHSFSTQDGASGYRFHYHQPNEFYTQQTIVDTDKNGNVKRVVGSF